MTGIAPVDGYAVGFHEGVDDHKAGRTFQVHGTWPMGKRNGYEDGWEWAEQKAREAAEDRKILNGKAADLLPDGQDH